MENQVRQRTAAQWAAENPVLDINQQGQETDTGLSKTGNGTAAWNELAYYEVSTEYSPVVGTDTYTCSRRMPLILSYFEGLRLRLKFANANTGASTINLNSFGAKAIKKNVSTDLAGGDILAGGIYELTYDGTNFQIKL